jgi:phosphatidylserine decarboxylase
MSADPLVYYDRTTGEWKREPVHAFRLLDWAYNTWGGRIARQVLASRVAFSRLYGWYHRTAWSRRRIAPFVDRMGIDLSECRQRIDAFTSFSAFFEREVDPRFRPLCDDPAAAVAPCDGKYLAYRSLPRDARFRIKGTLFDRSRLLAEEAGAFAQDGGAVVIGRLSLADYHHFHFPDSGVPAAPRSIPGRYEAGGPYARNRPVAFYAENHRMVTAFASDHFGRMALVEVGALTVGSIRQSFRPQTWVPKGARKGTFALGGSTVVLVFEPGAIGLDADLVERTRRGIETYVRWGQRLGRSARASRVPAGEARTP